MDEPAAYTALVAQMTKMLGYVPLRTKDLLSILTHPDMAPLTRAYLDSKTEQDYVEKSEAMYDATIY